VTPNSDLDLIAHVLAPSLVGGNITAAFMLCEFFGERKRKAEFREYWKAMRANSPIEFAEEAVGAEITFPNFLRRHWSRYGVVVIFVALALAIRSFLNPVLEDRLPYTFFLVPVILAARMGGVWKALLALVLGFLGGTWYFAEPNSLLLSESSDLWAGGLYLAIGLGLILFLKADRASWLRTLRSDIVASKQMQIVRQKNATQAEDARELLASIVQSAQDAIFSVSQQGRVMSWNTAAEQLLQIPELELIGKPLGTVVAPEFRPELQEVLAKALSGSPTKMWKTRLAGKGGATVEVSVAVSPIKDAAGKTVGASLLAREAFVA